MQTNLTDDQFDERFKPQDNHIVGVDNASYNGWMYETYGVELDYVLSIANSGRDADKRRVWTVIENDDGELIITDGYHLVNRIGYIITKVPCPINETIEVFEEI